MRRELGYVTPLTTKREENRAARRGLAAATSPFYNLNFAAHWCSWLTRCPLKAEITGSSPVCAAKKQ